MSRSNKTKRLPQLFKLTNEDLYQQGAQASPFYNASRNSSDNGSCCKLTTPEEELGYGRVPIKNYSPKLGGNPRTYIPPVIVPKMADTKHWSYASAQPTNTQYIQDISDVPYEDTILGNRFRQNPNLKNKKYDLLMKATPTEVYSSEELNSPENRLFLQDVEPNVFSYSNDTTPINSAIGVTYTPQIPPRKLAYIQSPQGNVPMYTRFDPQLIRDDESGGRMLEQPERTVFGGSGDWEYEAAPGTINYENIYDGRYGGGVGGDPYRSYSDVNLGQVRYFFSDIDSYRSPNFIQRNKIDHVDFTDPMGKTSPYYFRETAGLDDVREEVENDFSAKTIEFREDLMERQMRKKNSELWQNRLAPISRAGFTQTFTSGM